MGWTWYSILEGQGCYTWVAAVGALPLGFQVELGLVRGKYLSALLHAVEACNTPVILNLLSPWLWACTPATCFCC